MNKYIPQRNFMSNVIKLIYIGLKFDYKCFIKGRIVNQLLFILIV